MTLSFFEPCGTMKISSEAEIGLEDKGVMFIMDATVKELFIPEYTEAKKMRKTLKSIDITAYFKAL